MVCCDCCSPLHVAVVQSNLSVVQQILRTYVELSAPVNYYNNLRQVHLLPSIIVIFITIIHVNLKNVKTFSNHKACTTGQCWSPFTYLSARHHLHCKIMDTGLAPIFYFFTPTPSLIFIALTQGGMARLSWFGWLVTYRDSLPSC